MATTSVSRLVRVAGQGKAMWGIVEDERVYRLECDPYGRTRGAQTLARWGSVCCAGLSHQDRVWGGTMWRMRQNTASVPAEPLLFLKAQQPDRAGGSIIIPSLSARGTRGRACHRDRQTLPQHSARRGVGIRAALRAATTSPPATCSARMGSGPGERDSIPFAPLGHGS